MSEVIRLATSRQQKIERTRKKIIDAVIGIIVEGGFNSTSLRKVADRVSLPLVAVQKYFATMDDLLEAVLQLEHELLLDLVDNEELLTGSVKDRAAMYVTLVWRHYQTDLSRATLDILLAARTHRQAISLAALTEQQSKKHLRRIRQVFPECQLDDRNLSEVLITVHCFLTGLAVETFLQPRVISIGVYLRRITHSMVAMLKDKD